jgi:hypothetical protein
MDTTANYRYQTSHQSDESRNAKANDTDICFLYLALNDEIAFEQAILAVAPNQHHGSRA